eukprot:TRINITY_DN18675_c0_g1_i1.p1 TRINITY_DN18675_c0_g1~~TRINITY_DN18675_c0_g1_i1.p1  ORF type:complete len:513 (+),score=98.43 TRINITY_DN18675_c0_g1_i1:153-1691(+)
MGCGGSKKKEVEEPAQVSEPQNEEPAVVEEVVEKVEVRTEEKPPPKCESPTLIVTEDDSVKEEQKKPGPPPISTRSQGPPPFAAGRRPPVQPNTPDIESSPNASINDYEYEKDLGRGSFGVVRLYKRNGKLFAIKEFAKKRLRRPKMFGRRESLMDDVKREIAILKKLNHPNVLNLTEAIDNTSDDKLHIVMEFMSGGPITDGEATSEVFNEEKCREYIWDVISGLAYLHHNKIVHRDIKPENLLIDSNGRVRISDFGTAIEYAQDDMFSKDAGTPAFLPPEILEHKGDHSGRSQDVWAAGITLFVLASGRHPWMKNTVHELFETIKNDPFEMPEHFSEELQEVINGALEKDPEKRWSIKDLQKNDWVTNYGQYPFPLNTLDEIVHVTQDEIDNAFAMKSMGIALLAAAKLKRRRSSVVSPNTTARGPTPVGSMSPASEDTSTPSEKSDHPPPISSSDSTIFPQSINPITSPEASREQIKSPSTSESPVMMTDEVSLPKSHSGTLPTPGTVC